MAGILANSASVTMTAGTPDNTKAGFITNEAATLSVEPAASSYQWSIAKPQGASSRSDLTSTTDASPGFVPDTHGFWVITCVVDGGTLYRLTIVVEAVAVTTHGDASRYIPIGSGTVPAPALGATFFYSRDDDALAYKLPDGTVYPLQPQSAAADRSSLVLNAISPHYARVGVISIANPGTPTYPYNHIAYIGTDTLDNINPVDPAMPSVGAAFESSYEVGAAQSEVYFQVKFENGNWRPFYSRFDLASKTFDSQLRGRTQVLQDDGVGGTLITFNPTAGARTVQLADDAEIRATGGTASVTIRGVTLSGAREIKNNTNTPVKAAGLQMSGTSSWHYLYPRRITQETRPTLPVGASCMWHKPSTNVAKYLFNDPDEGHVSVALAVEP